MDEMHKDQKIADHICLELTWDGREFGIGDCVALLDGRIVAVKQSLGDAVGALREADPDPRRGMIFEVAPPAADVIR